MEKLIKPILLTGLKHCGKSSSGSLLSEHFNSCFIDLDDEVERIYSEQFGERLSPREIYKTRGRDTFQQMELLASERLASGSAAAPLISAAGGGICDNIPAVNILKANFLFVYIDEKAELLYERIIKNGIPAFLSKDNPYEDFLVLYKKRSKEYNKLSNIHIIAGGRSTGAVANEIINKLMEDGYAG